MSASIKLLSAALALVALTACGQSYCKREVCGIEPPEAQVELCEEQIKECNGSDERKLNKMADCFEDVTCGDDADAGDTGGFDEFADMMACMGELSDLSDDCLAALSTGMTTTTDDTTTFTY